MIIFEALLMSFFSSSSPCRSSLLTEPASPTLSTASAAASSVRARLWPAYHSAPRAFAACRWSWQAAGLRRLRRLHVFTVMPLSCSIDLDHDQLLLIRTLLPLCILAATFCYRRRLLRIAEQQYVG